jgi:membrane-bound lytic murein transglycosylase MltF
LTAHADAFSAAASAGAEASKPSLPVPAAAAATSNAPTSGAEKSLLDVARQPWTGDWDGIVKRRVLRVLVVYNRTLYFVDKGTQRGINYEVFKGFEDEVNRNRQAGAPRFHVAFFPVTRKDLIPALRAGRGDVIAADLTITDARARLVDFSAPVLTGVRELLVTAPGPAGAAPTDELSGRELFVRRSSSYWEHLTARNALLVAAGKPPMRLTAASENLEDEDLLEMLDAGLIPATVVDSYKATLWRDIYPRIVVHDAAPVNEGGTIAWAIRPGSPRLKDVLDGFIRTHGKGTLFGNTVIQHYWQSAKRLKDATSQDSMRHFRDTVELFRKYAGRYDLDYLLMMAQGYQESGLDQQARSAVGAIGIMQVMPETGRSLEVGDVTQLEPNIHAGVKYIRSMIDNYYAREPMTPLDRTLFAFASYNAGPGRIQSLRRAAAARGLDPNVWFGNVETLVAETVGQETVTYVANIYKYYVAYSLLDEVQRQNEAARALVRDPARRMPEAGKRTAP